MIKSYSAIGRCLRLFVGAFMFLAISLGLHAQTNDMYVLSVVMDAEQNVELNPGDPIRYTVTYGRFPATGTSNHGAQGAIYTIYLSTDGKPENINNFRLDLFGDAFPADTPVGEVRELTLTNRLPANFTGTYFLIAKLVRTNGANDPNFANNYPSVSQTGAARVTIRSLDSPQVSRLSTATDGGDANELSENPSVSSDGRYVVFQSEATNIVASPTALPGISQIYLRDTLTGTVVMVSQLGGQAGNQESKFPVISAVGDFDPLDTERASPRYFIAYQSSATNLVSGVSGSDSNLQTDIFLYDVSRGITTLVSVPDGAPAGKQGNGGSFLPSITADGSLIAFESVASNLLGSSGGISLDTNNRSDVFVFNRKSFALTAASATANGVLGNADSTQARISDDGSTVVFRSFAGNLAANVAAPLGFSNVLAKTLAPGTSAGAISRISINRESVGSTVPTLVPFDNDAFDPVVSKDGRFVAFATRSKNIIGPDGSPNLLGLSQVYVVNRAVVPATVGPVATSEFDAVGNVSLNLVSQSISPLRSVPGFGNDDSVAPTISGNGRYIGFRTEANDLLPTTVIRSDGRPFQVQSSGVVNVSVDNSLFVPPIDTPSIEVVDSSGVGNGFTGYPVLLNGSVDRVVVTAGGSLYPTTEGVVTVNLVGGGGVGFRGEAVIATTGNPVGRITAIRILSPGFGYARADANFSAGTGTGTVATATLSADGVKDVVVSDGGFGYYTKKTTITFVPPAGEPGDGATAVPIIENGRIYDIVVTNPGSGYISPPSVVVSSAPLLEAEAEVYLANGGVEQIVVTEGGSGYVESPIVEIEVTDSAGVVSVPGTATVGLTGVVIEGYYDFNFASDVYFKDTGIKSFVVTEGGSGYSSSFLIDFPQITGGGGSGARAQAVVENGSVSRIDLIDSGSGYLSEPLLTLPPPSGGGVQAVGRAILTEGADRLSLNTFGEEPNLIIGRPNNDDPETGYEVPSSRSITMSSNGRYVLFASDAESIRSFVFGKSNLIPLDNNAKRDVFAVDRRAEQAPTPVRGTSPTVVLRVDTSRPLSFDSSRVISVTGFDGGDVLIDSSGVQTAIGGVVRSIEIYANNKLIASTSSGTKEELALNTTWKAPFVAGPAQIYAIVTDGNGNRTFSTFAFVNVVAPVSQRPIISLSASSSTLDLGGSVQLSASVSDPENAIAQVTFYADGLVLGTVVGAPYLFTFTPTISRDYKLTAVVTDGAPIVVGIPEVHNDAISNEVNLKVLPPPSPTVVITAPAAGPASGASVGQPVFIEVSASTTNVSASISSVTVLENGSVVGNAIREGITSVYRFTWTPLVAGLRSITVRAVDSQGGLALSDARNFQVLAAIAAAPVVSIITPALGSPAINSDKDFVFQVSATDADGSIASVSVYANGRLLGQATFSSSSGYYELVVPAGQIATGLYDIVAIAVDNSGNYVASAPRSVVIASTPPIVAIKLPAPGALVEVKRGQPLPLLIQAESIDALSRITSVSIIVDGQNIGFAQRIGLTNEYTFVWTPDTTGLFKLTAAAGDSKGGTVQAPDLSVFVTEPQGAPPSVVITSPVSQVAQDGTVIPVTVTDRSTFLAAVRALDGDGIFKVEFYIDNKLVTSQTAPTTPGGTTYAAAIPTAGLLAGGHVLTAIASDNLGNRTQSVGQFLNVVAVAPASDGSSTSVTLASPVPGTVSVGQSVTLRAVAIPRLGASLTSIQFFANGALVGAVVGVANINTYNFTYTPNTTGAFELRAVATDSLGNTAISLVARTLAVTAVTGNGPLLSAIFPNIDTVNSFTTNSRIPLVVDVLDSDQPAEVDPLVNFYVDGVLVVGVPTRLGNSNRFYLEYSLSGLSVGSHNVVAVSTDASGNTSSLAGVFTVRQAIGSSFSAKPALTASKTTLTAGETVSFSLSAIRPSGQLVSMDIYWNGESATSAGISVNPVTTPPFTSYWYAAQFEGKVATYALATDDVGNVQISNIIEIVSIDNSPPTIRFLSPDADIQRTLGQTIIIDVEAKATTPGDVIQRLQIEANASVLELTPVRLPNTDVYRFTWTPIVANVYGVKVIAITRGSSLPAAAGVPFARTAETGIRNITIVNQVGSAPTATITSPIGVPANGTTAALPAVLSNGSSFPIFTRIARGSGDITSVKIRALHGLGGSTLLGTASLVAGTNVYVYTYTPRQLISGDYNLVAEVTDSNGNSIVSASVPIQLTNVPITTDGSVTSVVLGTPVPRTFTVGQPVNLSATASAQTGASIISVEYFVNGVSVGTSLVAPYTLAYTATITGSITIIAVATDSLGNQAASAAGVFGAGESPGQQASIDIGTAYRLILNRAPTVDEVRVMTSTFAKDKKPVTVAAVAAVLLQSVDFRDDQGELILIYLSIWGQFPTPVEYSALRTFLLTGDTDAGVIDSILLSPAYRQLYGEIGDMTQPSILQYEFVRTFALRSYKNLFGKAATGATANVVAQSFFYNISTLEFTPGQALVQFINENVNGAKVEGTLLTQLRIAGAMLFLGGQQPDPVTVNLFAKIPLANVADYFYNGGTPVSVGTYVESIATGVPANGTTFYASGLPKGLTINRLTGEISGRVEGSAKAYAYTYWTQVNGKRSASTSKLLIVTALDPAYIGTHEAILNLEDAPYPIPAGKLTVRVATTASYTASLMYKDGKTYSFKDVLQLSEDGSGSAPRSIVIKRKAPLTPLTIETEFLAERDPQGVLEVQMFARIFEGIDSELNVIDFVASGEAIHVFAFSKAAPAPWQGTYNVGLTDELDGSLFTTEPGAAGKGTLKVANTGVLSVSLKGTDGTKITGSFSGSVIGDYRLYIRPYSKKQEGFFGGSLTFPEGASPSGDETLFDTADDQLSWFRAQGTTAYPAGEDPLMIRVLFPVPTP